MTCSNSKYSSNASDPVFFTPLTVDQAIKGLSLKSQNGSSASLVWEAVEGVDGYIVSYSYPENQFMGSKFTQNISTSHIESKLSCILEYRIFVHAVEEIWDFLVLVSFLIFFFYQFLYIKFNNVFFNLICWWTWNFLYVTSFVIF